MNTTCERWHWSQPNNKRETLNKEYKVHSEELERIYDPIKHEVTISQHIIFDENHLVNAVKSMETNHA